MMRSMVRKMVKRWMVMVGVLLPVAGMAQPVCDAAGNVLIYSNYEGGYLTINVDQNIPNLKVGITTYEAVQVDFVGPFVGNITQVVYAGFGDVNNSGCGPNIPGVTINGVPPGIVTNYSISAGDVPIATHLGDVLGGVSLVNCIVSGDDCNQLNTGGGNSSPQIVAFFLDVFGAGSSLYAHWTSYDCFPGTLDVSAGGTCCLQTPSGSVNPIYVFGDQYSFFPEDTVLCGPSLTLDPAAIYPLLVQPPAYTGYIWSTGATGPTLTVTEPGTYWFVATDYCHTSLVNNYLSDTIVVLPCCGIQADVSVTDITCAGANDGALQATATGTGPFTFTWNTVPPQNTAQVTGLGPGTYEVTVSDGLCDTTITRTLVDPPPMQVQILGPGVVCAGSPATLEADVAGGNAPYQYAWSSGGSGATEVVTPFVDTQYELTVTDATDCSVSATFNVTTEPAPIATIAVTDTACTGLGIVLQAFVQDADSLAWTWGLDGFSNAEDPLAVFEVPGWNYVSFQAFVEVGCPSPLIVDSVFVEPSATADLLINPVPCSNEVRFLLQSVDADSCAMFLNDELVSTACNGFLSLPLAPNDTTALVYVALRADGCNDTLALSVLPDEEPLLLLPNAFTPNNDGINDVYPAVVYEDRDNYTMRIFDRWGAEVWTTADPLVQWDGTLDGGPAPIGVYAVLVERKDPCSQELRRELGHVTLVR